MEPTPIGILAILIAPALALLRPRYVFYAAVFFVPFSGTAVVNIKSLSFGLSMAHFLFAVFALAAIGRPVRSGLVPSLAPGQVTPVLLLAALLASLLASLALPTASGTLGPTSIHMLIYVTANMAVTILVACVVRRQELLLGAFQAMAASALFVGCWGVLQWACALAGLPYPAWIFNNSGSDAALQFDAALGGGLVRVGSVAVEPSILVQSLAFYVAVAGTLTLRGVALPWRFGRAALVAALLCIGLSTSSTGYFGLAVLASLMVVQVAPRAMVGIAAALVTCVPLLLLEPRLLDGVLGSTIHKADSWSFENRTGNIQAGVEAFLHSPLLGQGWASLTVPSLPVFLLSGAGFVGFSAYLLFVASLCVTPLTHLAGAGRTGSGRFASVGPLPSGDLAMALLNALLVSLAMQTVAGSTHVFLDFWVFAGIAIGVAGVRVDGGRVQAPLIGWGPRPWNGTGPALGGRIAPWPSPSWGAGALPGQSTPTARMGSDR